MQQIHPAVFHIECYLRPAWLQCNRVCFVGMYYHMRLDHLLHNAWNIRMQSLVLIMNHIPQPLLYGNMEFKSLYISGASQTLTFGSNGLVVC